jgi:hypothetical protein
MFHLRTASALCYRFFDVADEINLETCRTLLTATRPLALTREGSEFIQLSNPPIALDLGPRSLTLKSGVHTVEVGARIFDHGGIAIVVQVPIAPGTTIEELVPFADDLYDAAGLQALAVAELVKLQTQLKAAFEAPHTWGKHEEYTVLFAREIDGNPNAAQLLEDPNLARLLLGEVKEPKLSGQEVKEVLEHHFSYTDQDLAIIEWNATFLYEPSGSDDIVDLLEIANAQLLELRYFDEVLDKELGRVYDNIDRKKRASIFFSPYKQLLRDLMLNLIELSEFIERVENSLKIVGDVYLARVYESSVAQLRIKEWSDQVARKHRLLQQTYGLLRGEVDTDRALTLEIMVVVLIVLELLVGLIQVTGH